MNADLADVFDQISDLFATAALIAREGKKPAEQEAPTARPEHFDGKNFSAEGVRFVYSLFDQGYNRYQVSKIMDVSFGAATWRHQKWLEQRGG